jgi:hypothetical protein
MVTASILPSKQARSSFARRDAAYRAGVPRPSSTALRSHVERDLKRITSETLDALKHPAAIPSDVILESLLRARQV